MASLRLLNLDNLTREQRHFAQSIARYQLSDCALPGHIAVYEYRRSEVVRHIVNSKGIVVSESHFEPTSADKEIYKNLGEIQSLEDLWRRDSFKKPLRG